jgi:hypothetical protein
LGAVAADRGGEGLSDRRDRRGRLETPTADEPPRGSSVGLLPMVIAAASLLGLPVFGNVAASVRQGGTAPSHAEKASRAVVKAVPEAGALARTADDGPRRASPALPAAPSSTSSAGPRAADYVESRTAKPFRGGESWDVRGGELVHTNLANQYPAILFGDERWTDYDFSADLMRLDGQVESSIVVRGGKSSGVVRFVVGRDQSHFLEADEPPDTYRWLVGAPNFAMTPRKWYTARVRVRGNHFDARLVDGDQEVIHIECDDPKHPAGGVGFYSTYASFKYKNIRVAAPDGSLMWQGTPAVARNSPPSHRPLFNGKTLSGWTGITGDDRDVPPEEIFQVVDGTLACRPDTYGAVLTRDFYGDFRFSCEFRVGPRFDSGIRLVPERNTSGRFLEFQVMGDFPGDDYGAGDVYSERELVLGVTPGDRDRTFTHRRLRPTISQTDWNKYVIRREGPILTAWINGEPVSRIQSAWTGKWRIGFNAERNPEVRFRNVEIDENPGPDADPSASALAGQKAKAQGSVSMKTEAVRQPAAKPSRKAENAPPADGKPLHEFGRVVVQPMSLSFSADGKKLLVSKWAYNVKVFDMDAGDLLIDKALYEEPVVGDARDITGAAIGPDGQMILAYADQMIRVRDRKAQKLREMSPRPLGQPFRDLRYSAKGKWVVGRGTTQVGFWDVATGKELKRVDIRAVALDLHPNGRDVVIIDADHVFHIWNAQTGAVTAEFPDASKQIERVRFTPDGRFLLCWSPREFGVFLVDPGTGESVQGFHGHAGNVTSAAAFPDRPWVASTSLDRTLRLWDGTTGEPFYEIPYPADARQVVVSPDGRTLVVVLSDETIFYRVSALPAARRRR